MATDKVRALKYATIAKELLEENKELKNKVTALEAVQGDLKQQLMIAQETHQQSVDDNQEQHVVNELSKKLAHILKLTHKLEVANAYAEQVSKDTHQKIDEQLKGIVDVMDEYLKIK